MFEKINYNANNERVLCEIGGKHADMNMNIKVKKLNSDETFTLYNEECETAFLILQGDVAISWNGETKTMTRETPFVKAAFNIKISPFLIDLAIGNSFWSLFESS